MTKPSDLYACLYVKEFPAQALLRLRTELRNKPCVVMDGEPPLQYVCSCNVKSRSLGIAHGMTQVEIDTFSSVTVLSRSRMEEATAKAALLECAGTFSPRVEDLSNDKTLICGIDIAGTEKLFGPPVVLAKRLRKGIRGLGMTASIAAQRIVRHLERCGYVLMKRPPIGGSAPENPPPGWPHTKPEDMK